MTDQQFNDHIESVDLNELEADKSAHNLCGIYSKARPVLQVVANFPILPQKVRVIVQGLIAVLDGVCPQS